MWPATQFILDPVERLVLMTRQTRVGDAVLFGGRGRDESKCMATHTNVCHRPSDSSGSLSIADLGPRGLEQ